MENLKNIQILIFDMDGTLYRHDGDAGTFKNSSLHKKVILNSLQFVLQREGGSLQVAQEIIDQGLKDSIGISNVLSKRYGIKRSDYFDIAWNINPGEIIKEFDIQRDTVVRLNKAGKRLFLLTGAPRIWMENVMTDLGLSEVFERKFNGEMFGKKDEIFDSLAKEFDPKTLLSVGDQFESDLAPAQKVGMNIFQVKKPDDLLKLI